MLFNACFFIGIVGIVIMIIAIIVFGISETIDNIWGVIITFLALILCIYFGINQKVEVEHKVIEACTATCTDTNCTIDHSDSRRYYIVLSDGKRYEISEDEYTATKVGDIKYISRFE